MEASKEKEERLDWFSFKIYMPVMTTLAPDDDEEDSTLKNIRFKDSDLDEYEQGVASYDLSVDAIKGLEPCNFLPKGFKNKKNITRVCFSSGEYVYSPTPKDQLQTELIAFLSKVSA